MTVRRGLGRIGIEVCPLFIHAEVRIIPRKQRRQQLSPLLERLNHEVDLPWRKTESRRNVLVDQQIVAGHLLDHVQAIQETLLRCKEVAVEQAVVVHDRGRKRISYKEDGL